MRSTFAPDLRFGLIARFVLIASVLVVAAAIYAPSAHAADFDPNYVLSDAQLRDYRSMSQADIQAFLETKPGILKEYRARDHNGKSKAASQIIYDACVAWKINPKVMLALLQKENSLISNPDPTARALERAVGAGCPNSVDNRYPGFGPQVWNGARMLDGYGEGKTTTYIPMWHKGTTYEASNIVLRPHNVATFKLYVYNPVIGAHIPYGDLSAQKDNLSGNASFWHIYWRYWGDPTASVAAAAPAPAPSAKPAKKAVKKAAKPAATKPTKPSDLQRIARYEGVTFVVSRRATDITPDYYVYPVQGEGGHLAQVAK